MTRIGVSQRARVVQIERDQIIVNGNDDLKKVKNYYFLPLSSEKDFIKTLYLINP